MTFPNAGPHQRGRIQPGWDTRSDADEDNVETLMGPILARWLLREGLDEDDDDEDECGSHKGHGYEEPKEHVVNESPPHGKPLEATE